MEKYRKLSSGSLHLRCPKSLPFRIVGDLFSFNCKFTAAYREQSVRFMNMLWERKTLMWFSGWTMIGSQQIDTSQCSTFHRLLTASVVSVTCSMCNAFDDTFDITAIIETVCHNCNCMMPVENPFIQLQVMRNRTPSSRKKTCFKYVQVRLTMRMLNFRRFQTALVYARRRTS